MKNSKYFRNIEKREILIQKYQFLTFGQKNQWIIAPKSYNIHESTCLNFWTLCIVLYHHLSRVIHKFISWIRPLNKFPVLKAEHSVCIRAQIIKNGAIVWISRFAQNRIDQSVPKWCFYVHVTLVERLYWESSLRVVIGYGRVLTRTDIIPLNLI